MKREIRLKVRDLRQQGHSIGDIALMLSLSKSTVSVWVRDIELTSLQVERLKEKNRSYGAQNKGAGTNRSNGRSQRIAFQEQGRLKAREGRPLHLAGCMLYWAEGSKDRNTFYFVNSDANMLRLCMRFLREEMAVGEDDFTIRIHCHSNDPIEMKRVEQYWLDTLGLPVTALCKTQFKQGSDKSKRILANGICALRIRRSTHLVQHVYGAIQEYTGSMKLHWQF
jgi:transposase-like protein